MEWVLKFSSSFNQLMGFDPTLMIPVFALVWIVSELARVRERFPDMKTTVIAAMNFTVSLTVVAVYFFTVADRSEAGAETYMVQAFKLGGSTAFLYQFFMPSVKMLKAHFPSIVDGVVAKTVSSLGVNQDEDEGSP